MFSLLFAITGMIAVFIVITILTVAMLASSNLFSSRSAGSKAKKPKAEPRKPGSVPEDHVAVIAAAMSIHRGGSGADVALFADEQENWGPAARGRPGRGHVPALRRTR